MLEHYILKNGRITRVGLMEWATWINDIHSRCIDHTVIRCDGDGEPEVEVFTTFLGIDHGFDPNAPPILFETMIFGGSLDMEMRRYCTMGEAKQGHWEMVDMARKAEPLRTNGDEKC